ncbi:MAG: DISARM system helicase DrmA [Archangium sp.]|nr:DISARM system helicase DrmA [Archangium sp.]
MTSASGGSGAVRSQLIEALEADLVGPFRRVAGEATSEAPEVLRIAPSRWYLTGFLVPREQGEIEDEPDDADGDATAGDDVDDEEGQKPDPTVKKVRRMPASMGLSVLIEPGVKQLEVTVSWADYVRLEGEHKHWSRKFQQRTRSVLLTELSKGVAIPDSGGLSLEGRVERTADDKLAVAVFVVNNRQAGAVASNRDEAYAFQVRLVLSCPTGFVGRYDRSDERSEDTDDNVNDLQFRKQQEWGVGHGVAVDVDASKLPVTQVATTWIPRVKVPPVEARELPGVVVEMELLAVMASAADVARALAPLVASYRTWIDDQLKIELEGEPRRATRETLVTQARRAADRIDAGLALLATDPLAFDAFLWMNEVMARAERKARPDQSPKWRLFQLAFILLNLPSMANEDDLDRDTVELIFFPTGGGKTQAYLGLIAFTLLLRRLRGQARPDGGLGVAVLLRYTLRLLTLDQLGRASTLICALELLRRTHPTRLGEVRFSIGLWVGRSATANTLKQVAVQLTEYKNDNSERALSPFPLAKCPWCSSDFKRESFIMLPNKTSPTQVLVGCANVDCDFNTGRNREGLPVLFVDEQIYEELPCFLVATVDKFALLPWRGETGLLFGRALGRTGKTFVGPCNDARELKAAAIKLPKGLPPPELIVQDELHLISGPLGSMVGLYEAAVLTLAPKAKVVASTATVRRARQQVERLYGRRVALFPPPGVDVSETFFARVGNKGAREYVGVAAPGRPLKAILLRTYVSLLAAAMRGHEEFGAAADPYLTLVGYFNSLRELGGMRRLIEDEVRLRTIKAAERAPEDFPDGGVHPWYRGRTIRAEPIELTSRLSTAKIKEAKDLLAEPYGQPKSVDVVLASNMISVGVDIDRLGLMVMAGQPKTTSEYIQASSRVGRKDSKPGLVVTVLNVTKPRDRSHYERFGPYHESFYRFVEATSVTPFSAPALDRGLAGVVVALGRLLDTSMTAPLAVKDLHTHRAVIEKQLIEVMQRAGTGITDKDEQARLVNTVVSRVKSLLDAWRSVIEQTKKDGGERAYSPLDPDGKNMKSLLREVLAPIEDATPEDLRFEAPLSMRDVEASVHLWMQRQPLGGYKRPIAAKPEEEKVADGGE